MYVCMYFVCMVQIATELNTAVDKPQDNSFQQQKRMTT